MKKHDNKVLNKLEIPLREGNYVFEKSSYREEALSGLLNKAEFDLILEEAGKIMGDAINKKRENDEIKLPRFIVIMSGICVALSVVYTAMLVVASNVDSQTASALIVVAVLCLFGAIVIAFGLSVYNFCRRVREFKSLEVFIKEDLDYFFETINSKYQDILEFIFIPNRSIVVLNVFKKSNMMDDIDITERRVNYNNNNLLNDESDIKSYGEKTLDRSNRYLKSGTNIELTSLTGGRKYGK
jgi:hypothetical protein